MRHMSQSSAALGLTTRSTKETHTELCWRETKKKKKNVCYSLGAGLQYLHLSRTDQALFIVLDGMVVG